MPAQIYLIRARAHTHYTHTYARTHTHTITHSHGRCHHSGSSLIYALLRDSSNGSKALGLCLAKILVDLDLMLEQKWVDNDAI